MTKTPITVAYGDGIGPEIMTSCLQIMEAAGAQLDIQVIELGQKVFLSGNTSGIPDNAWDSIHRTGLLYKAPITTPQGGGYKSINVTLRTALGLYANVRPVRAYYPFVQTKHLNLDIAIIRENEEDLYTGIEHRQSTEVFQTLKLISRPGTERIVRYAFEYARSNNRKKVTCFTKDNIMKMTDGLFHKIFDEIAAEYPDIENHHMIIDIGAARVSNRPEDFDVIVMPNLYGDIVSDIVAELTGSVGLAGSANIGQKTAMFEAIHGSAPDIAGKGIANPSGLLLAGVMLLAHIGQMEAAEKVHNAWLRALEDGMHTRDIFNPSLSKVRVNTEGFTLALIERLGQRPLQLKPVKYTGADSMPDAIEAKMSPRAKKELVGVDVFLDWTDDERNPDVLGKVLEELDAEPLKLIMISNRGQLVYPESQGDLFNTDHWRCRFQTPDNSPIAHSDILDLLDAIQSAGFDFIKTENLYFFDGQPGFSLGQGQ